MFEPLSPSVLAEIKRIKKKCEEKLERNPFDLDAMFTLAAAMARLGDIDLAIDMIEGLLAVNPAYPGGLRLLAKLHQLKGDEEKSRECYERALALGEV
ncbi:MAG: hypothetical protein JSV43_06500 [Methanobacteriota archaeon]|nr:MAG: hypothetical protein JSV43_06500 [Euryarchaeota archaeon]